MSVNFSINPEKIRRFWLFLSWSGLSISKETFRSSVSSSSYSIYGSSRNSATLRWPYSIIFVWWADGNWLISSSFEEILNLFKLSPVDIKASFNIPMRQIIPRKISSLVSLLLSVSENILLFGREEVSCISFFNF